MPTRNPRTAERSTFPDPIRIQLLEQDADEADASWEALRVEIAALRQVLVGILVAVTTASILLAVNLVVRQ